MLFPPRCPICDGILEPGQEYGPHLHCESKILWIEGPTCFKCGQPISSEHSEYCYDCNRRRHAFVQGKACFQYDGQMKLGMYRFKYSNRREYANWYATACLERYGDWLMTTGVEAILPVPMYKRKERQRGYNQAEVFAKALAHELGVPCEDKLVLRTRNTVPQKQLNVKERENNLKNAFHVTRSIVKYRSILLVDDIYTTGSTMDALAKELQKYGITNIFFLTICIGRRI